MKKHKRSFLVLTIVMAFVGMALFLPNLIGAGDLDPPAGPDEAGSAMFTLTDIYNYLVTGIAGTKRTGGFTEPSADPGLTGHTLDEIHAQIAERCITCEGTLNGTRWCDNGDGTVTDMTTGLIWLQNASWGGQYPFWVGTIGGTNAHDRAAALTAASNPELSDGSVEGDWRLPTKTELYNLANGTEAVRSGTPRAFTGVQSLFYWSSTTYASDTGYAWFVHMYDGDVDGSHKDGSLYVWPVRSDN